MPLPTLTLLALTGVALDRLLGEPRRWHPLVGFGTVANKVEGLLRRNAAPGHPLLTRLSGLLGWMLLVLPPMLLALAASIALPWAGALLLNAALLWFSLGARSLEEHAEAIAVALEADDLPAARQAVARIVSRDTAALNANGVAKAGVETVLENGNDAVFGALFWFFLLGGPGALMFRLANTLDAMWGYRTDRLRYFGWAAARIDDVLNYLPARLTALTYAALGHTRSALQCWRTQARAWDSPNAGPVMAAGAGALEVTLGGAAQYHGREEVRPPLGCGAAPTAADIRRALRLVRRGIGVWLLAILLIEALGSGMPHA
ncbi:MAG TPA: adenosylcobinamide-phosphate synthase CbiB [Rhodocyclaceae bacterium]